MPVIIGILYNELFISCKRSLMQLHWSIDKNTFDVGKTVF